MMRGFEEDSFRIGRCYRRNCDQPTEGTVKPATHEPLVRPDAHGSPHIRARCAAPATHDPVVRPACGRAAGREPAVVSKEVLIIILHF